MGDKNSGRAKTTGTTVNQKMKILRKVVGGLRSSVAGSGSQKQDSGMIEETLRSEHFQIGKVRSTTTLSSICVVIGLFSSSYQEFLRESISARSCSASVFVFVTACCFDVCMCCVVCALVHLGVFRVQTPQMNPFLL